MEFERIALISQKGVFEENYVDFMEVEDLCTKTEDFKMTNGFGKTKKFALQDSFAWKPDQSLSQSTKSGGMKFRHFFLCPGKLWIFLDFFLLQKTNVRPNMLKITRFWLAVRKKVLVKLCHRNGRRTIY